MNTHHRLSGSPAAVLVIDDAMATRTGIVELLRLRGYHAFEAADGAEGLNVLRANSQIGLVILDLHMPGASGYWFRDRQVRDQAIADVPVVVFTGIDGMNPQPDAMRGVAVLRKPLAVDELFEVVRAHCAGSTVADDGPRGTPQPASAGCTLHGTEAAVAPLFDASTGSREGHGARGDVIDLTSR
jgi:CheY-like chemotaxis protein